MVGFNRCHSEVSSTPDGLPYLKPIVSEPVTTSQFPEGMLTLMTKGENVRLRQLLTVAESPKKKAPELQLYSTTPTVRPCVTDDLFDLALRDGTKHLLSITSPANTSNKATHSKRNRKVVVEAEKEPDDLWYLTDSPLNGVLPHPSKRRHKGYSLEVVSALKNNPSGREAFREKVGKMKELWKRHLRIRNRNRNLGPVSLLSPRCREELIVRNAEKATAHRAKVQSEAVRRKLVLLSHNPMQVDRQTRIRKSKAFAVVFLLSKASSLFSHTLRQWRNTIQASTENNSRWNVKLTKLKVFRQTILSLRTNNNNSEEVESCLQARQNIIEQQAKVIMAPHIWILAVKVRIIRKRRAVRQIASFLTSEKQKGQISHIVKRLVASAKILQRWWRSLLPCVVGHLSLLEKQWTCVESTLTCWDTQSIEAEANSKPKLRNVLSEIPSSKPNQLAKSKAAKRWPDPKQRDQAFAIVADRQKWMSHQGSQIKVAKAIISCLPTTSIEMLVPEILRKHIIRMVASRLTFHFRKRIRTWECQLAVALSDWTHDHTVATAKSQINELKGGEKIVIPDFCPPPRPVFKRLLHPNEMRLLILVGYQVHMKNLAGQAVDSCGLSKRRDFRSEITPTTLLDAMVEGQAAADLTGISSTFVGDAPNH
eukprot:TRINITY_DN15850_c0_g1_i1.p1 TRINITY_DN15850_c0_g1~~TRINITY_DN15850_c0_g1_i1.p1  ORF type:complete len:651 (+),score=85.24 TRINITY_DN15850_c0_g1_i1:42-1994(+)